MRKILLGSSALLTALVLAAPAMAELEVNVGGFVTTQAGFFDNDQANNSGRDFRNRSEIRLTAKGVADNGLEYGARVDLLTSSNLTQNARRTGINLSGDFGRLEMGDLDGASNNLTVLTPSVGIGQVNGSYVNFIPTTSRPAGSAVETGGGMIRPMDSDQSTKITYYTPRAAGFQAGISYTPEVDSADSGEAVQFSDALGNHHDMIEAGLNYRAKYDNGIGVRAGVGYVTANSKDSGTQEDINAWGLGLRVSYSNVELGATYVDNGDSSNLLGTANDDETSYALAGSYKVGPWGMALSYIHEDYDLAGGRGTDISGGTYSAVVLGGTYKIAEGLTTGADLAFFDRNKETGTDDNGYVLVLETKASF